MSSQTTMNAIAASLTGRDGIPREDAEVTPDDLIDAQDVARLLGLSHAQTVSTYQRRYSDMPKPWGTWANGRFRLWLRSDVEAWAQKRLDLKARQT